MGVVDKSVSTSGESGLDGWHIDTSDFDMITWRAHSGNRTSSDNLNLPRNMTDWHLVGWLLNFDILVAHEFRLFNLENKLTLNVVLDALNTWAFDHRGKLFLVDDLINFVTAGITCEDCNLDAWLNITASGNDTLNRDE